MSRRTSWLDVVAVALVAAILYASLADRMPLSCSGAAAGSLLRQATRLSIPDFVANTFAYALLGAVLALASTLRRGSAGRTGWRTGLVAVLGCSLLSLSVEAVQLCLPGRVSSGWDWLANTAGAALGWLAGAVVPPAWRLVPERLGGPGTDRPLLAVVLIAVLGWLLAATAPWLPSPDIGVLRHNVGRVWFAIGGGDPDWWRLAHHGSAWLALGLVTSLPIARPALAILAFAAVASVGAGLRLVIDGAAPSAEWVLSLPIALSTVAALDAFAGRRSRAMLALLAAMAAMAIYQLRPEHGTPQAFSWSVGLLLGEPIGAIQLAAFVGWYAATLVAAGRVAGGRPQHWALGATALIVLLELAQTAIPGRTPDLSPVLLTALIGWGAARMLAAR